MKKLKLTKNVLFSKCRTFGFQRCSYCGNFIGKGNYGLSIRKGCFENTNVNVWIHLKCIENFSKGIIKFKKDNIKELILRNLK